VAGVMHNGDIGACLDIPRNDQTIQGNIKNDSFPDVWENRFEIFRSSLSEKNETCRECKHAKYCRGGSYHSWDYDKNEQKVCMRDILF